MPIATVVVTRAGGGAVGAYLVGAVGVLLLGGREGATINYFLDLSAALALVGGRDSRRGSRSASAIRSRRSRSSRSGSSSSIRS